MSILVPNLPQLRIQYSNLERRIKRLSSSSMYDQLAVQRLKREKNRVQETIERVESELFPNIIA